MWNVSTWIYDLEATKINEAKKNQSSTLFQGPRSPRCSAAVLCDPWLRGFRFFPSAVNGGSHISRKDHQEITRTFHNLSEPFNFHHHVQTSANSNHKFRHIQTRDHPISTGSLFRSADSTWICQPQQNINRSSTKTRAQHGTAAEPSLTCQLISADEFQNTERRCYSKAKLSKGHNDLPARFWIRCRCLWLCFMCFRVCRT